MSLYLADNYDQTVLHKRLQLCYQTIEVMSSMLPRIYALCIAQMLRIITIIIFCDRYNTVDKFSIKFYIKIINFVDKNKKLIAFPNANFHKIVKNHTATCNSTGEN